MDDDVAGSVELGVTFPAAPDAPSVPASTGALRSTSRTGREVLAAAAAGVDDALAGTIRAAIQWRRDYLPAVLALTRLGAGPASAEASIATAGLAAVHRQFVVAGRDGDRPLASIWDGSTPAHPTGTPALHTVTVTGSVAPGPDVLSVPYRGGRLVADALDEQLSRWAGAGVMEPSAVHALRDLAAAPHALDLRDLTVVVLGAGAQMAPLLSLLRWGAHVVAVDLPVPAVWRRLIEQARNSPGRLSLPTSRWLRSDVDDGELAEAAGVDVVRRPADVLEWLAGIEGPFTLGSYVYADGAAHVRAVVAIDAVTQGLLRRRHDVSLAFLATPTDAFVVPEVAVQASRAMWTTRTAAARAARMATAGRLFSPNYDGVLFPDGGVPCGVHDALVPQQGPNYALAKRIQRWRALDAHLAGQLVSINVAPATRTRSVLRNRALAAAYSGAHHFGVEVFDPSTSATLMAALLVHDLRAGRVDHEHPSQLLSTGAVHGGLWRTAYAPRSVLGIAVVVGAVQRST